MGEVNAKSRAADRYFDASERGNADLQQWISDVGEGRASFVDCLAAARKLMLNQHGFKAQLQLQSTPIKKVLDETR
jgi:hypothetical protein